MHMNMPRFHDAQPGFFALQSAHLSFPGTLWMSSWSCRSLRACWRLDTAVAMLPLYLPFGRGVLQWRTWLKRRVARDARRFCKRNS